MWSREQLLPATKVSKTFFKQTLSEFNTNMMIMVVMTMTMEEVVSSTGSTSSRSSSIFQIVIHSTGREESAQLCVYVGEDKVIIGHWS